MDFIYFIIAMTTIMGLIFGSYWCGAIFESTFYRKVRSIEDFDIIQEKRFKKAIFCIIIASILFIGGMIVGIIVE